MRTPDVLEMDEELEGIDGDVHLSQSSRGPAWWTMTEPRDQLCVGLLAQPPLSLGCPAGKRCYRDADGGWLTLAHDQMSSELRRTPVTAQGGGSWPDFFEQVAQDGSLALRE